eukprot:3940730-Rhodomonas_salina.2
MSGTDVACTTMRVRGTSGTEACGTGVRFRTEEEKNNALVGELRTMEVPFRTTGLSSESRITRADSYRCIRSQQYQPSSVSTVLAGALRTRAARASVHVCTRLGR